MVNCLKVVRHLGAWYWYYEAFLILGVWFLAHLDFVIFWVTLTGMLLWARRS